MKTQIAILENELEKTKMYVRGIAVHPYLTKSAKQYLLDKNNSKIRNLERELSEIARG